MMQIKALLSLYFLIFTNCSIPKIGVSESTAINIDRKVANETPQEVLPLKPIVPTVKLNSKQKKRLDAALPLQVRKVLENAEKFEVLTEDRGRDIGNEGNTFEPNRIARITLEKDKKEVLEVFYLDASSEDNAASCYEPHHGIRAIYQGKIVEIEICFDCARFYVTGIFGKFGGTIVRDRRKSEDILNRIMQNQGVEMSK